MPRQCFLLRKSEKWCHCTALKIDIHLHCLILPIKKTEVFSSLYSPTPVHLPLSLSLSSCAICRSAAGRELGCSWQDPHPLHLTFKNLTTASRLQNSHGFADGWDGILGWSCNEDLETVNLKDTVFQSVFNVYKFISFIKQLFNQINTALFSQKNQATS